MGNTELEPLPELKLVKSVRFTEDQWAYLTDRAREIGVREPQIYLRMLVDQDIKARVEKN
jgi:hypothetical protein